MNRTITPLLLLSLLAVPAFAADVYEVDADHSEAAFQIRHLVTKVRGHFDDFSGTVHLDRDNPAASSVQFTMKAASIDTGHEERDEHLRGEDFFAVDQYPEISFTSTEVSKAGDDSYEVTGPFTMRGVTQEITLSVSFLGEANDPWGNTRAGFETEITLDRKEFGINWNAALDQGGFILGDEVRVTINLETIKQKPGAS